MRELLEDHWDDAPASATQPAAVDSADVPQGASEMVQDYGPTEIDREQARLNQEVQFLLWLEAYEA